MIKCGLCGKEFEDGQFDEYAVHVNQCAAEQSMRKKTEEMKKINEELEEVKRAKVVYEGLRDTFKEKYPDIYRANFLEDKADSKDNKSNKDNKTDIKSHTNTENPKVKVNVMDLNTMKEYKDLADFINSLWIFDI